MLSHYSPKARYVKSARDLSHIELARSDNISSLNGWGSPKRRMSFGGSQHSENISSSSFVNIFHESEYIDRKKNKSKNSRISPFTLALSACNKGLGLAYLRLTSQMRCSHLAIFFKFSDKNITLFAGCLFCIHS